VNGRRPGREGAVEALTEAARALFVEHGPSAVSLRDVAKRAGVNHGLIHHYSSSSGTILDVELRTAARQVEDRPVDQRT
jgi:AcrR family transcriptional regulator